MKVSTVFLIGISSIFFAFECSAQVTASLSDELGMSETSAKGVNPTLSYNRKVKLTNTDNGKSVVVRINDRVKSTNNSSTANISKTAMDELGVKSSKTKIKIQEIEGDDEIEHFWATADASNSLSFAPASKKIVKDKEVEIETTKLEGFDVNHVYDLNGKMKDLSGFGLQLAAFGQLKSAKDFAIKLARNGEAEIEKIFIQVSKSSDKPMVYRVVYGLFQDEVNAKDTQKKMENLGYDSFVKGF